MTMHALARPAGPDAPWSLPEAPKVRDNALPHDAALISHHLRKHHPVFQALSRRAWVLYLALGVFLRRNDRAYPSQATLAKFTGYSPRTLYRATRELIAARTILTWTTRWADGRTAPLRYAYGPATYEGFADVAACYPRGPVAARAKPLPRPAEPPASMPPKAAESPEGFVVSPSDKRATRPSDKVADKLLKRTQKEPSSCEVAFEAPAAPPVESSTPPSAAAPPEEEVFWNVTSEDRAVAKEALTLRALRKNPKRPAPAWWDKAVVELVAVRVAQTPGTREEKFAVQTHALAGAWLASRDRAPTVRFIWDNQEHFLEHVERGRKKARNDARQTAYKAAREAEAERGWQPPSSLALTPSRGAEAPQKSVREVSAGEAIHDGPPIDLAPRTQDAPADVPRLAHDDTFQDARTEARALAQKRIAAQRAAAALAAAWGEDDASKQAGDVSPDLLASRFLAARREIEAEVAALKRGRMALPPE